MTFVHQLPAPAPRSAPVDPELRRLRVENDRLQAENDALREALRAGVPDIAALGLPRLQRIVLATLMRFAVATVRQCLGAMDAEAPIDDGRDRTAVENAICHLRVALKPHGITITTERFIGYRLSVEDKARVRELCARAA